MQFLIENNNTLENNLVIIQNTLNECQIGYQSMEPFKFYCHVPNLLSFELRLDQQILTVKQIAPHRVFFYAVVDELVRKLNLIRA
jgi:hypothetical protein